MKKSVYLLPLSVLLFLMTACEYLDDKTLPPDTTTLLLAKTRGTGATSADRIQDAVVYIVDPANRTFIKRENASVASDGTAADVGCTVPPTYKGRQLRAYFIANASVLSDLLDMAPGDPVELSRFENLTTGAPLHGDAAHFVMSATTDFRAGDTAIPELGFNRTFAKVYASAGGDMAKEEQRDIRMVSVQIISGSAAGYLFRDDVVTARSGERTVIVDKTLDALGSEAPLCFLYPDDEGAHLTVVLRSERSGREITRRVTFRPRRNIAHRLIVTVLPEKDDYSITVSDWDTDIVLPDKEVGGDSEIHVEEGIDLINKPEVYYYYNLLNDSEKELYRSIFHTTNNFTETPPPGGRLEIELPYSLQSKFTKESFNKVTEYLWNDMPVLFNSGRAIPYRVDAGQKVRTYRLGFNVDRAKYDMRVGLMIKAAREFLNALEPGKSEFEIVKNVHDKFLRSVSYGGMTSALAGTIVGGLVDKKIVCEGYSATLQYLLQRCGIQALFIGGEIMSSGRPTAHAWNMVRVDGKYYYIDSTWDDGMAGLPPDFVHHTYFLKSRQTMDNTHKVIMNIPIPECPEDYPLNF